MSSLTYGQAIDEAGVVASTEIVVAGNLTLFNSGSVAVGTISAYSGISAAGAATVVNAGQIIGNRTGGGASGITLSAGGSVTHQAGGTITAYTGIQISGGRVRAASPADRDRPRSPSVRAA